MSEETEAEIEFSAGERAGSWLKSAVSAERPTPSTDAAEQKAFQLIADRINERPINNDGKEDGSYNFIHRTDAITAVQCVSHDARTLERELAEAKQKLDDHAEDWAVCGIPHDSLTAKLLVAQDENRRLKHELAATKGDK